MARKRLVAQGKATEPPAKSARGKPAAADPEAGAGLTVDMWPIERVIPYHRNARKNDAAVDAVARSISEFGWRQPIVVDADGVIVIGHTRLKAAIQLKQAHVPVHVATGLSAAKVRALRIADNKVGEIAEWDDDLLAAELRDLAEGGGPDMLTLGFDAEEYARLIGDAEPEGEATGAAGEAEAATQYEVIVSVADEAAQKKMYDELTGKGLTCRVLTY